MIKSQAKEGQVVLSVSFELLIIDSSWIQTKSLAIFDIKITPIAWREFHEGISLHESSMYF